MTAQHRASWRPAECKDQPNFGRWWRRRTPRIGQPVRHAGVAGRRRSHHRRAVDRGIATPWPGGHPRRHRGGGSRRGHPRCGAPRSRVAGHRWPGCLSRDAEPVAGADHRGERPRRGDRTGGRSRGGCRRLPGQAVRPARAGCPHSGRDTTERDPNGQRTSGNRRPVDRPTYAAGVTRNEILSEVWDPHWYGPTRTLDVHVAALRKKLGSADWIETIRSIGYRLGLPK